MRRIVVTGLVMVAYLFLVYLAIWSAETVAIIKDHYPDLIKDLAYYQNVRMILITVLFVMLAAILFFYQKEIKNRDWNPKTFFRPSPMVQAMLGPSGGARSRTLLVLIPGLGQAAAGRTARAVMAVLSLLIVWIGFFYLYSGLEDEYSYFVYPVLPVMATHITAAFCLTLGIWTMNAVDAIRLNESGLRSHEYGLKGVIRTLTVPLISVAAGVLLQFFGGHFEGSSYARLSGWGGASAGLFGIVAWRMRMSGKMAVMAAGAGLLVGAASLYIMVQTPVPRVGMILYRSLVGGTLIGLFLLSYFYRWGIPSLIVPAVISASWAGTLAGFYLIHSVSQTFLKEFLSLSMFRSMTLVEFYFIGLAVLGVMHFLEPRAASDAPEAPAPDSKVEEPSAAS